MGRRVRITPPRQSPPCASPNARRLRQADRQNAVLKPGRAAGRIDCPGEDEASNQRAAVPLTQHVAVLGVLRLLLGLRGHRHRSARDGDVHVIRLETGQRGRQAIGDPACPPRRSAGCRYCATKRGQGSRSLKNRSRPRPNGARTDHGFHRIIVIVYQPPALNLIKIL